MPGKTGAVSVSALFRQFGGDDCHGEAMRWEGMGRGHRPVVRGSVEDAAIAAGVKLRQPVGQASGIVHHFSDAHQRIGSVETAVRLPAGKLSGDSVEGLGVVDHGVVCLITL